MLAGHTHNACVPQTNRTSTRQSMVQVLELYVRSCCPFLGFALRSTYTSARISLPTGPHHPLPATCSLDIRSASVRQLVTALSPGSSWGRNACARTRSANSLWRLPSHQTKRHPPKTPADGRMECGKHYFWLFLQACSPVRRERSCCQLRLPSAGCRVRSIHSRGAPISRLGRHLDLFCRTRARYALPCTRLSTPALRSLSSLGSPTTATCKDASRRFGDR